MSNFKGNISISRCSNDMINIRLRDKASRAEFVDVQMTLEDFASAVTGLAEVDVIGDVRGLDKVGKVKVLESRQTVYPGESYADRSKQESYIIENCQEDGWELLPALRSQGSIKKGTNGETLLNYSVVKYVEQEFPIDDHWEK